MKFKMKSKLKIKNEMCLHIEEALWKMKNYSKFHYFLYLL